MLKRFVIPLITLCTLMHRAPTLPVGSAVAQVGTDWPQLQQNPQRTGYTPEEVHPPFRYLWKWNEVPFAGRTQPVVSNDRLFVGALDGIMYARDAHTGAPLWSYSTDGPIRHSAAVGDGRLFFGSYDGSVYALNVTDGSLLWRYETEGGIATAPVLANGTIYIGSTDGVFYALDTNSGIPRWTYDVGFPILTSAALSSDGSSVYFGAEDIFAYALSTPDGRLAWRTQLRGQSLADRWPVVVGDLVIYRSQSLYNFHNLLKQNGDDVLDQTSYQYSGLTFDTAEWARDWNHVRPEIIDHLTQHPDQQTYFALDSETGDLAGVAPVLFTYGNGDAPAPPVVRENQAYLLYRARHGIQTDSGSTHVSTRYDAELGRMSLDTLDITGLTLASGQNWNVHFRATSDEPQALSLGGTLLFVDNWERLGGIDVESGELFEVANVADDWPECYNICHAKGLPMPFFESYPFPGPRITEGRQRSGAVIADGVIYWRVIEGGLAAIVHDGGGSYSPYLWPEDEAEWRLDQATWEERQTVWLDPSYNTSGPSSPPPLSTYVWSPVSRPVPYPPQHLVVQLEEEVQAMVDAGHLAPFFLEPGFTSRQAIPGASANPEDGLCSFTSGDVYWFDPGELVYSLSLAYPYLSTGLQAEVRSYLAAEMDLYPPLSPLPYPASATWFALDHGARRESYSVTYLPNNWPPPAPPFSTLYALWTYADATGDWDYLQEHWSEVDDLFDSRKNQVDSYMRIAGAIGYARIADHLGYETQAEEGESVAVAAMAAGTDFDAFLTTANQRYPDSRADPRDPGLVGQHTGTRAPVFFGLVPDVGHYMHDYLQPEVDAYLSDFTDFYDGDWLWYVTRLGVQRAPGESSFHGPELAWSIFLAKVYGQGMTRTRLRPYLDRPWGLGDLYHIQKLVALIEADDSADLSPSIKMASAITPQGGDILTYTICLRNSGGPLTVTTSVTDVIPSGLLVISDSVTATLETSVYGDGMIRWSGTLSAVPVMTLTYAALVTVQDAQVIRNEAVIDASPIGVYTRARTIIANGHSSYLPLVWRNGR